MTDVELSDGLFGLRDTTSDETDNNNVDGGSGAADESVGGNTNTTDKERIICSSGAMPLVWCERNNKIVNLQ